MDLLRVLIALSLFLHAGHSYPQDLCTAPGPEVQSSASGLGACAALCTAKGQTCASFLFKDLWMTLE